MGVTLKRRKNDNGTTSIILNSYYDGIRKSETLSVKLKTNPITAEDKQQNSEVLALAKRIQHMRSIELQASKDGINLNAGYGTRATDYLNDYLEKYKKADITSMRAAITNFETFLRKQGKASLTLGALDELDVKHFWEWLKDQYRGETPASYFRRFKKAIKHAQEKKLIANNPTEKVQTKGGAKARRKPTLTLQELAAIDTTPTQAEEVKRAFLFCAMTGLRWCDVKKLKWSNINRQQKSLSMRQSKTGEDVYINLNSKACELLNIEAGGKGLVFDLPTNDGANKSLKALIKRAGIEKHISWHNARHTFGTNLIHAGAEVTTASALLGHSSLAHTQRYVKAANELKQKATDSISF